MKTSSRPPLREVVARSFARLIPNLIRGAQLDFFQKRNITQTQFLVIVSVHSYGQCPMGTLAGNMHVTMPTMTGVVDRLVASGYLRRKPNPDDRRHVIIELTAKGRQFVQAYQEIVTQRWIEALGPLEESEIAQMKSLLEKMLVPYQEKKTP